MPDLLPQPAREELELGLVLSTLSDPLRRTVTAILATLPDGTERNCASFGFPVAKASLTHHFKILRQAGLISQTDYGNRRASSLRRDDIEARFPGLLALLIAELQQDGGALSSIGTC